MEKKYNLRTRAFYKFLKKHRLLDKYLLNLRCQHPSSHGIIEYDMDGDILALLAVNVNIDRSFCWADTPQGHRYWEHLNYKEIDDYRKYEKIAQIMHPTTNHETIFC